jgi:hypothetical protein
MNKIAEFKDVSQQKLQCGFYFTAIIVFRGVRLTVP